MVERQAAADDVVENVGAVLTRASSRVCLSLGSMRPTVTNSLAAYGMTLSLAEDTLPLPLVAVHTSRS